MLHLSKLEMGPKTARIFAKGIVLALLFGMSEASHASPFTPPEWQQRVEKHAVKSMVGHRKHTTWVRDRNRNFIDDQIETFYKKEDRVDVILDLNAFIPPRKVAESFSRYGKIRYVGKLITCVFLDGVRYDRLHEIARMPEVAMIEVQEVLKAATDVSVRAVQVRRSETYSPNSAEEKGVTGSGVNIAVLDTGVDDSHDQLTGSYRFGFNALVFEDANINGLDDSCEAFPEGNGRCSDPDDESGDGTANPDDEIGHGTMVAAIALGRGAGVERCCSFPDDGSTPCTCAGVAPKAGLIDIKVCRADDCPSVAVARGLDWLGENRVWLSVRVANISFAGCSYDDGTSALAKQVDQLTNLGVTMVVAHGNSGNCYPCVKPGDVLTPSPGSASSAITVAGANDRDTVIRDDDEHYVGHLRGPRIDFNLMSPDPLALKPDIAAPAQKISSAQYDTEDGCKRDSGTSFAAPHVSGAVALILEKRPGMRPEEVKDLLKRSADTGRNVAAYPTVDPHWDSAFGFGLLNVWPALDTSF